MTCVNTKFEYIGRGCSLAVLDGPSLGALAAGCTAIAGAGWGSSRLLRVLGPVLVVVLGWDKSFPSAGMSIPALLRAAASFLA